jgi:hypothetical protein
MGLNAYFTYQVVGVKGSGSISYRVALLAIFMEGWIFMFLALTGMRHWLVKIIPGTIKIASGVGIGMFLTLIGMTYTSGIGLVTGAITTPLAIGGCPAEHLDKTGQCASGVMTNPKVSCYSPLCHKLSLTCPLDVDRHYIWWPPNNLSDGVPCQGRHHHWYRCCLNSILDVRDLSPS